MSFIGKRLKHGYVRKIVTSDVKDRVEDRCVFYSMYDDRYPSNRFLVSPNF
ncbi:MAG: hypothetical protein WBB27_17750 [Maribacter sp.]